MVASARVDGRGFSALFSTAFFLALAVGENADSGSPPPRWQHSTKCAASLKAHRISRPTIFLVKSPVANKRLLPWSGSRKNPAVWLRLRMARQAGRLDSQNYFVTPRNDSLVAFVAILAPSTP